MAEIQSTTTYRQVPGHPHYRVGDDGSVWCNLSRNGKGTPGSIWRRLKPRALKHGHLEVALRREGGRARFLVHRLVLLTFVGPCPHGMEACHYPDRSPANCALSNLRWDTHAANMADKNDHGTDNRGEKHPLAVLSDGDVLRIRSLYASGEFSQPRLAQMFGVNRETIGSVVRRESWRHL